MPYADVYDNAIGAMVNRWYEADSSPGGAGDPVARHPVNRQGSYVYYSDGTSEYDPQYTPTVPGTNIPAGFLAVGQIQGVPEFATPNVGANVPTRFDDPYARTRVTGVPLTETVETLLGIAPTLQQVADVSLSADRALTSGNPSMASIWGIDLFKTAGGFLAGGPAGAAAAALAGVAGRVAKRSMTPADPTGGGSLVATQCPPGMRTDANGVCRRTGIGGILERVLPGDVGQPGTLYNRDPDQMNAAVAGAMGIPALVPLQVGTIQSLRGNGAILKCPRGMTLGKDDLCYVKGSIPRGWRKWPPGARPPVSAGDARAIRQASSARGRVKKLAQKTGFTVSAKGGRRGK